MLTLSRTASEAIKDVVRRSPDVPDELGGIRLFRATTSNGRTELVMGISEAPEKRDAIVEQSGVRVFVEPALRDDVAGKRLDVSDDGDGWVGFRLHDPDG